jgi:hypothetical protein
LTTSENRQELDRLAALADLMSGVAAVLARLSDWSIWQPGYQSVPATTIPDALAAARLGALLSQYRAAGIADDGIEAAVADVRARLGAYEATGATIAPFYEKFLNPIAGNSAARSTEQKEEPSCL